jgi:hypothetical protein
LIIIGSRALDLPRVTVSTDYDVMMTQEQFNNWINEHSDYIKTLVPRSSNKYKAVVAKNGVQVQYEIELGVEGTSTEYLLSRRDNICIRTTEGFFGEVFYIPSMKWLMATKRSHLIYPIHFEKNIEDYHLLKKVVEGSRIDMITGEEEDKIEEYYKLRYSEAAERNKQRTPNLNVTTEDFFSSKLPVPNYFVHDHIHEMMTHYEKPIFSMMQKDSSKAWCSKDLFFELPYKYQVQCVMEEAYVIALERYIIPQHGENYHNHRDCYNRAVKRICTTLTSGWFRDFAIENYPQVTQWYDLAFVNNFVAKAKEGKIKPVEGFELNEIPLFKKYSQ